MDRAEALAPGSRHESRWSRPLDIAVRILVGAFFALSAMVYFRSALTNAQAPAAGRTLAEITLDAFSTLACGLFFFTVACLYVLRQPSVSRFAGITPTVVALLAAFVTGALAWLPLPADLPAGVRMMSGALIILGNLLTIVALKSLGRSFSILPEGRRLVSAGPYRYVRHPVYATEAISTFGAMLTFLSPAAVIIVLIQYALQIWRLNCEESVLRQTFPEYEDYCARVPYRLVPGIY